MKQEMKQEQMSRKIAELIVLGVQMRESQRNYFADRSRENLVKAKQLEKRFDFALNYFIPMIVEELKALKK